MRLRSIELHGYKSFAARTALQFDSPLTAVVGPNGSGKSNVMDGLRWVIGAGSGRALRTRRAEDVVFTGGRDRAPAGFAEVRVQLDNSERWLDLDAAEIEIVRRVHRDGQSDIRVNGRPARLREVQDLFRNGGLGAGGFALMSQGLVDEMLRLRPFERRQAIEEVGGVRQHRHRMEESRRRRERAQDHLERARLLRDELTPRLRSLERAARRARQVHKVSLELGEARRDYFHAAAAELEQDLLNRNDAASLAADARASAEAERASATNALANAEREAADARQTVESSAEHIRNARSQLRTLEHQQELDQQQRSWLARQISDLSERVQPRASEQFSGDVDAAARQLAQADLELSAARKERDEHEHKRAGALSRRRRAQAEIEECRTQATGLARRWRMNASELALSLSEISAARTEHQVREAEWRAAAERFDSADQRLAEVREGYELNQRRAATLDRRIQEIDTQTNAFERRLAAADTLRARVYELTDDHVRADAIFGELMDATLHDSSEEAIDMVRRVVEGDAGRALGLPLDRADELIRTTLESVDFVDTLGQAASAISAGSAAATHDGIVIRPDGVVQGGGSQPGAARLRRQLDELRSERSQIELELRAIPPAEHAREELNSAERIQRSWANERETARLAATSSADKLETLRRRRGAALSQHQSLRADTERVRVRLAEARSSESQASSELEHIASNSPPDLASLERRRDDCAAALAEARARAASADRDRADRARLASHQRELADVESAIREREPQLEAAASAAAETSAHNLAREQLDTIEQRRAEAQRQVERTQQARLASERRAVEADASLRESEAARARLATEAAAVGIDLSHPHPSSQSSQPPLRLNGSRPAANGADAGSGSAHATAATTVALAEVEPVPVSQLRQQVQNLESRLQRLGPVDPGAAAEYESEHARWEKMETQIEDLERTEQSLREAERDLEQQIERQFREACRKVDEAFQRYFQLMFRGGHAELVLTEESDGSAEDGELEDQLRKQVGVEIRAQPPGKRVSTLGLLSGGERALTAIALLFALLEVRPAPFCILDEVDAALDEANVERFVNALKERAKQTQFVVITHNRRTIEQADSIYGVTMGAAGVSRLLSVRVDQATQAVS